MGFWKVLGGIAVGVGAVAVLPVAVPIAAAAAIGGAGSGLADAAAKAAAKVKDDARRSGEEHAKAQYEQRLQKFLAALKKTEEQLHDDKAYFDLLIALYAVGLATAYADGNISDDELADLEEFITGIGRSSLPPHIKEIITRLRDNPPNFNTAMNYVSKLSHVDQGLFESVIEVISASDGKVTEEEAALLSALRKAVA